MPEAVAGSSAQSPIVLHTGRIVQPLKPGQMNVVKAMAGERYRITKGPPEAEQLLENVVARRIRDDLHLSYADGTQVTLENFYVECGAGACELTLPSRAFEGYQLGTTSSGGAALGDGSVLAYAHGSREALTGISSGDAVLHSVLSGPGGAQVTYLPPVATTGAGSATLLGLLGGGLGIAAAAGAGGGAAAVAAVATSTVIAGTVVAGPVVAGHGLTVKLYAADGTTLLGSQQLSDTGTFSIDVGTYAGAVIAKLEDSGGGVDFIDEATGEARDMTANLMAVGVAAGGTVSLNLNPLTTIAAIKAGASYAGASPAPLTAAVVVASNTAVGSAFGISDLTGTAVVTTVDLTGAANANYTPSDLSAAEKYGAVLAALSGVDAANGGNMQATIDQVVAGLTVTGGSAALSSAVAAAVMQGAITASATASGSGTSSLMAILSDATQQLSAAVTIDPIATDGVITAAEQSIVVTGTTLAGATVNVGIGASTRAAVVAGTTWSYSLTSADIAALGEGSATISATATLPGGSSTSVMRRLIVDTIVPTVAITDNVAGTGNIAGGDITYTFTFSEAVTGFSASDVIVANATTGGLAALSPTVYTMAVTPASGFTGNVTVNVASSAAIDRAGNSSTAAVQSLQAVDMLAPRLELTSYSIAENATAVATLAAIDTGALTYTLAGVGADNALFRITPGGVLRFASAPNFETPIDLGANNVYDITVNISDTAGNVTNQAVSVSVTNVNDNAPVVTSGATASFAENSAGIVYTASGFDADAGTTLTYALGGTDAPRFNINASSGAVTFISAPNHEAPTDSGGNNVYDITVTAHDGVNTSAARAVSITVTNVVETPGDAVIDLGAYGKLIAPVQVDRGQWYYHWDRSGNGTSGGSGSSVDFIDHNTLDAIFNQDVYGVVGGGGNTTDTYRYATLNGVRVALPVAGRPPVDGNYPGTSVGSVPSANGSNEVNSTYDGLLAIWDAYNGTGTSAQGAGAPPGWQGSYWSASYAGAGNGGMHARINLSSGGISIVPDNYGVDAYDQTYVALQVLETIAPTVTNAGGVYMTASNTLVLGGGNYTTLLESGEGASTDIKARLDWSKLSWDINGDNQVTPDVGFTLADISSARVIDDLHLSIRLFSAKALSLEATEGFGGVTADTLDISVGFARDVSGNVATTDAVSNAALGITSGIDIAPVIGSDETASFAENGAGTAYTVTATGVDAAATLTYTLGGTDAARFSIDASSGAVTFVTPPDFEAPADSGSNNVYDVIVTASDGANTSAAYAVAITVTNVGDAGDAVIDLGNYGRLIAPVQVDGGKWYYHWDRIGNDDSVNHNILDATFNQDVYGVVGGGGNTTNTYRYATLNGVRVALPTLGGDLWSGHQGGTAVGSADGYSWHGRPIIGSNAVNPLYDDLLAVWDAHNGTGAGFTFGLPPGWPDYIYWSASFAGSDNHFKIYLGGGAEPIYDSFAALVALQVLETFAPTVRNTAGTYTAATNTLVLTGSDYNTLLDNGEDTSTDIKVRLDWSKLSWDINGDNAVTPNVGFTLGEIISARVIDDTHLSIVLTSAKGTSLEAASFFGGPGTDTLDIAAGFARDASGNVATTDAVANAALSVSYQPVAGDAVINLGSYGNLILPVQVDGGKWYYHWDRSGDGTSGGNDSVDHNILDAIFNQDINGVVGGGGDTTDTYRYATINGVRLALPTVGGAPYGPRGIDAGQSDTTVGSEPATAGSNETNAAYNDLLAIWDAYNGRLSGTGSDGTPSGWNHGYWSATPSSTGHAVVYPNSGYVNDRVDGDTFYVALQVFDTTAPTVVNTSGAYTVATNTLILTGTNYSTLLERGETASTDIKTRLDWSRLSWDINGDDGLTADVGFVLGDISSARVTDNNHLSVVLANAKGASLEAAAGFGGATSDTLDIAAGFARDVAGNVATTDAVANASVAITPQPVAGDEMIDLGAYGRLIAPVQVDGGNWYYYWDRSGDGTTNYDLVSFSALGSIFNEDINGIVGPLVIPANSSTSVEQQYFAEKFGYSGVTDVYRYATLGGVRVALPTLGSEIMSWAQGTGVGSAMPANGSNAVNATYDDLLAVWDAYNGTGTEFRINGVPPGWTDSDNINVRSKFLVATSHVETDFRFNDNPDAWTSIPRHLNMSVYLDSGAIGSDRYWNPAWTGEPNIIGDPPLGNIYHGLGHVALQVLL